ncbi:MAG TPA: FtsX-like permease family protein [Xanthobacteraceae bacterium]|jgi:putative ABC transport system permease protein|nr:FtsX-like permease family protein [Xanthobacteraceae bacterium]
MSAARTAGAGLTLRLALRELRGGLRGFYVFIACIALGVLAIAAVGSFAQSLADGLSRQGRMILGGDVAFSLIQREATSAERTFLASKGDVSAVATLRAMVRTADGRTALVEAKAVDAAYPLYGKVVAEPDGDLDALLARQGDAFGAVVDAALLTRLGLRRGARVTLGAATIELRAVLASEPDKLAGGIGFGPRLLIGDAALRATGLLQPGSLVRWSYRLRLPAASSGDADAEAVVDAANAERPEAGWETRTRNNATPLLERNIERFSQYLTLVGLTALLVGGVGVANSAKHHLDGKREVIATMKSLGATGTRVVAVYFIEVLLLAGIGIGIGIGLGAALPFAVASMLGDIIPLPIAPALYPGQLALALAYGVLTAATFALWPLGRAHDLPVSALFRDEIAPERRLPRPRYLVATAAAAAALAALAVAAAYDRGIAAIFIASALLVFGLLRLIASLVMLIARRVPRPQSTVLRLAVANIYRPGALTPTVVISLGLGLALLVTVLEVDANLRRQFAAAIPERAPSFYFLDIPVQDADRFDDFVRAQAPRATLVRVPMLRGRIVAAHGTKAEDLAPKPDAAWVLQSDRGITYTSELPAGSRLTDGAWWDKDYAGPTLVSFEKKVAEGLGLKIGDDITVNVLGRNMTARIANLRTVDWQSLGINFVMVFSPAAFAGAPVTDIATVTFPGGGENAEEGALMKAVSDAFPGVTAVRVKEALDAIGAVVTNLVLGVRAASAITLIAAVLVLGGALAAGHRHRVYDAVILKTLGATRRQLMTAYAIEYLLLGGATVVFGVAAGSIAGRGVVVGFMALPFRWQVGPALVAAVFAVLLTLVLGLAGTWPALGRKPAAVLRNL